MKILFVNASLKGHVHPTLEMAEVLIRRGHEVSYFTGEDFREAIQELGGTFVPFSDKLSAFYSGYRPSDRHPFFLLTEFMLSWDEAMLPEVIELCRREKFDLLICDSVFGGAFFLRQILEVPVVVSHSTFAMRRAPVPDRMLEPGFHPQLDASIAIMERIASTYDIAACSIQELFVSKGDLNLVYTGRDFGGMPEPSGKSESESVSPVATGSAANATLESVARPVDAYLFVGPSLRLRTTESDFKFPEDGRPIVFLSMGSIGLSDPAFFRTCIEALRGTRFHGILAVGHKIPVESLGELPENISAAQYVPQLKILSRSAVFVTHAGFNSTHEAILIGVPMLALPFANDQFIVAKRITELGLGETMDLKAVTAEDLRAAIIRLDGDEAMRGRIRDMAEMMRSGPTREDAAVAMERLVESHRNAAAGIEQLVR